MNNLKYTILLICLLSSANHAQNNSLRIMTYNIRYANNNVGEEWFVRRDNVAEMIRFHKPDIFGLQEALLEQVTFILDELKDYKMIGDGREDGKNEGEFSPLFISHRFTINDYGTFWLSETPNIPSLGWDANYKRIATWAIVKSVESDESLFVVNTHFDHQGEIARKASAKLLMEKIQLLNKKLPIVLTGDFNFSKESECYSFIDNYGLVEDAYKISENVYGTDVTFNGFEDDLTNKSKIDFIFVSSKINVIHHAIIGDKFNGVYPSDHMPVIMDFKILK